MSSPDPKGSATSVASASRLITLADAEGDLGRAPHGPSGQSKPRLTGGAEDEGPRRRPASALSSRCEPLFSPSSSSSSSCTPTAVPLSKLFVRAVRRPTLSSLRSVAVMPRVFGGVSRMGRGARTCLRGTESKMGLICTTKSSHVTAGLSVQKRVRSVPIAHFRIGCFAPD